MNSQPTTPSRVADSAYSPHTLRGRWLTLARVSWLAVVLVTAIILFSGAPGYFSALHEACTAAPCIGGQLSPEETRSLDDLGIPTGVYAAYVLALDLFLVAAFSLVGAVIFWRRSEERAALFASFALVMFGLTWPGAFEAARRYAAWGDRVGGFLFELGLAALVVLLLTFPDGRFVPRWTRWVAAFAVVEVVSSALFPDSFLTDPPPLINLSAFIGLWGICSFAQAYRYRRVSGTVERQQVKWLVFGVVVLVALLCAYFLPYVLFPTLDQPGALSLSYELAGRALVGSFAFMLIPLAIGAAVLRHRLLRRCGDDPGTLQCTHRSGGAIPTGRGRLHPRDRGAVQPAASPPPDLHRPPLLQKEVCREEDVRNLLRSIARRDRFRGSQQRTGGGGEGDDAARPRLAVAAPGSWIEEQQSQRRHAWLELDTHRRHAVRSDHGSERPAWRCSRLRGPTRRR